MAILNWLFCQTAQRPPIPEALSVRLVANGREVGSAQITYRLIHHVKDDDLPVQAVYYDRKTGETVATQDLDQSMPGRAVGISAFPGDRALVGFSR